MSIITQLEQSIESARHPGYDIRFDWFGGTGGGICQVNGKKVLFIDLALSPVEQLERVRLALGSDPSTGRKNAA